MEGDSGQDLWNLLPEECKSLILERLTTKQLARAAPVAAHRNLSFLSFKRYGGKINSFVPLLEAATGNFPCTDIGAPVFWRRRSLEAVDFRGCVHLSDADIAELCWLHPRIEEVNLAGCQCLSDSALVTLSRHRRANNLNAPPAEDELDNLIDRVPVEVDSVLQSDVASLQLPELGLDHSDHPGQSVDEGEDVSFLAEAWPLPGAGVKPENLVTRDAGSPGKDEKPEAVASVSTAEGALSESALCSSDTGVVASYAQAAARASQVNEPPLCSPYFPSDADDTAGVQAEIEKIRGWPKKAAQASQTVSKGRAQVDDKDLTCRTDVSNLSRSTVGGSKLRFASLMTNRPPDLSGGTGLKAVCLASLPKITDHGVQALLKGASRSSLVTLDISRCAGITNNGLRVPSNSPLENLTAVQMPSITRLRFLFSDDQGLRTLNLAGCPQLEELMLVGPRLQTLNLAGCKRLSALQLKCPNLEALNMSLCENIQRFGRFECSALQNLNVVGCRLLSTAGMAMILESSNALQELRCSGCDRIDALTIPHLSLVRLEASGCSALKRLVSLSRILRVVDTCGCKSLKEIRLSSPFLQRMLFTNCSQLKILVLPLEGISTTAQNGDDRLNQMDDEFEISINGAYSLHEVTRKRIEKLSRQMRSLTAT